MICFLLGILYEGLKALRDHLYSKHMDEKEDTKAVEKKSAKRASGKSNDQRSRDLDHLHIPPPTL